MEETIKEKLIEKSLEPVSLEKTKQIINQMQKSVCKIYINGITGTGFFTEIPYKNELKKVLITNNHILGESEIENGKIITFIINNNEEDIRRIKMDEKRMRYTNEILDITIIEIDENKDGKYEYIEIDDNIKKDLKLKKKEIIFNYKNKYEMKSIYILNYRERILVSYGILSEINEKNGINHKCNTQKGSSGSPILNLQNNKLIGIHCGASGNFEFNKGTLIIYPIIKFNEMKNNICIKRRVEINKLNEIKILYKIKEEKKIKLFGKEFIEKNKDNCKIIIDNKEQCIMEYIKINEEMRNKKILELKLKEIKTITNMSHMFGDDIFNGCESLLSLPDIDKWDTHNVTNMSHMFMCCKSLTSLPDISKWDTKKVTNMSHMFSVCESLSALPNISIWNTQNVSDMSNMFNGCKSLSSLPDISKWNTKNVYNMSGMFNGCKSLPSIPDITKLEN